MKCLFLLKKEDQGQNHLKANTLHDKKNRK